MAKSKQTLFKSQNLENNCLVNCAKRQSPYFVTVYAKLAVLMAPYEAIENP